MSDAVKGASLYSPCFWTALAALHTHGVADAHAGLAQALWTDLATRLPSEPDLSVDEGVKFVWMSDRYTLEVEVLSDGRKTWYEANGRRRAQRARDLLRHLQAA